MHSPWAVHIVISSFCSALFDNFILFYRMEVMMVRSATIQSHGEEPRHPCSGFNIPAGMFEKAAHTMSTNGLSVKWGISAESSWVAWTLSGCHLCSASCSVMSDSVQLTPWTIQSMAYSRLEHWSGKPFPSPGDLPNPGLEPRSPALQADSLPAEPKGSPRILEWVAYPFSSGSFQPKNWTGVSCIAGGFLTNWAIREAPPV